MSSPAITAGELLSSAVVGGVSGWTLKFGHIPSEPDQVVVFTDSGGQNPNPRWRLDYPTFQAMIRGKKGEYDVAWNKAKEVKDGLLGIEPFNAANSDRWDGIICMGDIGLVGYDDNERPMLSVNFRAIIEPATGNHREAL